jgi:hypothetical protein
MALTFTSIVPADGESLARLGTMAFTLSSDTREGQGVRIGVYVVSTDTEETAWNGSAFVGKYVGSAKSGDDFIIRRRGGWPTGGVQLRVQELGSVEVMSIWTDGTGAPDNGVGEDGDYYLDSATGAIYKRAGGTYSAIYTPSNGITALTGDVTASGTGSAAATITNSAITEAKIANGAVTQAKIAVGAVASAQLAANSVGSSQLIDSGVTTAKITDSGVTTAKIADASVTSAKLASGAVSVSSAGELWSVLNGNYTFTNLADTYQSIFPAAQDRVTLAANTTYWTEATLYYRCTTLPTAHFVSVRISGVTYVLDLTTFRNSSDFDNAIIIATTSRSFLTLNTGSAWEASSTNQYKMYHLRGIIRTSGSTVFNPEFKTSASPGVTSYWRDGSFWRLVPIGTGSATTVGGWA